MSGPGAQRRTGQRSACAAVLADAFAADPWAAYVLGEPGMQRYAALEAVMRVPVALAETRGGLLCHPGDEGQPVAVSTWVPAQERAVGFRDAARARALTLPLRVGPATMRRLNRDEAALDDLLTAHALRDGGSRDAYLWVLGVARHHHGQGLGRNVVNQTCDQARARGYDRLVLNTDNPANVPIYRALGFDLLHRAQRPSGLTAHLLARPLLG